MKLQAIAYQDVDFYDQRIPTAMKNDIVHVAMKPVVLGMGLDWKTQSRKLENNKKKFNYGQMTMVASDGKSRLMGCIPLRKLNGWLFSINPEKVKASIRKTVVRYQEECFQVLHDYWHNGIAVSESVPLEKTLGEPVCYENFKLPVELATIWGTTVRDFNKILDQQGFQKKELSLSRNYRWKPTEKGKAYARYLRTDSKPNLIHLYWDIAVLDEMEWTPRQSLESDPIVGPLIAELKKRSQKDKNDKNPLIYTSRRLSEEEKSSMTLDERLQRTEFLEGWHEGFDACEKSIAGEAPDKKIAV